MQVRALYDHGHLVFLDRELPSGQMEVTVTFPDDAMELSEAWKAEIERRQQAYQKSGEAADGETFMKSLLQQ